jgi:cation:H+ antiporter
MNISLQTKRISYPFLLLSSIFFGVILYFCNGISFWIGVTFVISLVIFSTLLIRQSRQENLQIAIGKDELLAEDNQSPIYKSISFIIVGIILLKFGADYFIDGAIALAKVFSVSNRVIAVTVIAIGTSIPELATTVVAALKKEESLAVGNLIGSNIFNILAVLGLTAIIKDISLVDDQLFKTDYLLMMAITILLGLFIYLFSNNKVSRREGIIFLTVYVIYIIYTVSFKMG